MHNNEHKSDWGPAFEAALEALLLALPNSKVAQMATIGPPLGMPMKDRMPDGVVSVLVFADTEQDSRFAIDSMERGMRIVDSHQVHGLHPHIYSENIDAQKMPQQTDTLAGPTHAE